MSLSRQLVNDPTGPATAALVVAALCGLAAWHLRRVSSRRQRALLAGGAVFGACAAALAVAAARPKDAMTRLEIAVEDVLAKDTEHGCKGLRGWRDDRIDPPASPAILEVERGLEAATICADSAIDAAMEFPDAARRERALLEAAVPSAPGVPNVPQLRRILEELGGSPERVRLEALKALGPRSEESVRPRFDERMASFRACQRRARDADEKIVGLYTVSLHVAANGRVVGRHPTVAEPPFEVFHECVWQVAQPIQLDPRANGSVIKLTFRLLP